MEKTNKYLVILTIVAGFMAIYFIFKVEILLPIALGIAVASIASSFLTDQIVWVWEKIALILGTVNSKILLTAIFYIFLVPVAFISRLFKKQDSLILKRKTEGSYYKERSHEYISEDLENVF